MWLNNLLKKTLLNNAMLYFESNLPDEFVVFVFGKVIKKPTKSFTLPFLDIPQTILKLDWFTRWSLSHNEHPNGDSYSQGSTASH